MICSMVTGYYGLFVAVGLGMAWSAFAGPDPRGDASAAQADIASLDASGKHGQLRIELITASDYGFENTQILLDTDLDAKTGFTIGSLGADILVEGANIYAFDGQDTSAWSWNPIGTAQRRVDAATLTLTLDGQAIGSDRVALIARTLADDYATPLDRAPDDAGLLVTIESVAEQTEATGDADDPSRDITAVTAAQEGQAAVITVTTAEPFDFATTLIFFDTDDNAETGYQPSADPRFGFEFMLSGGTLSRHNGADRAAWDWVSVGQAEQSIANQQMTARFNAALLDSASPRVAVWNMSGDWQTLIDRAPDRGLYDLTLDPGQLDPVAPEPQIAPAAPKANRDLSARRRVAESESFYCYYGSGKVNALSHYDVVILHSPQMAVEDIAALKALGVVTIGYITVGEDDEKRVGDGTGPAGLASWYFDRNGDGEPDRNAIWNSWYANANDPNWRADRVKEAKRLVNEEGYDGIFLDTLDTAQLYPETADGMVQLVADLREALPDSPIILNQGFKLFDRLAPMADGLMLESFTATFDFQSQQYMLNYESSLDAHTRNVNKNLQPVLETHPMPIFVLDYARPDDREAIQTAADRAASFGYQFAAAPIYLDEVYVNDIVGEPDPKWLKMQATPESMSVVLAEPANGFPAGTKLVPSSCFAGYTVAAIVDGVEDRSGLHWTKAAWASSEDTGQTWLSVELPTPTAGGELVITWAVDSGETHVSRDYVIEVQRDGQWSAVASANGDSQAPVSRHPLPNEPFDAVRIVQPDGGGSVQRPGLMWIGQLALDPT